jgi:peptide/nickel transport system permease protein
MRFVLRRLVFYLAALWVAITLNFAVPRMMPGDPATVLFAQSQGQLRPDQLVAMKRAFGLTGGNIFQQYTTYLDSLAHGNLARSFSHFPTPVTTVIRQDLPWTLLLVGLSVILSFLIGTLLGIVAAWRRNSWLDTVLPPVLLFAWSFPPFFLGLCSVFFLALKLHWFPLGGAYDTARFEGLTFSFELVKSILYHALLPALILVLTTVGSWMLGMRNNMVATLAEDYITMAEAKGLRPLRVMLTYAARNAILPQITAFAIALGFVVSGQVLIEVVFNYPGVGFDLVQAAKSDDYPLLQGLLMFIVVAILVANFCVDLLYAWLDPRVRQEG